jgi:hypothetical protein
VYNGKDTRTKTGNNHGFGVIEIPPFSRQFLFYFIEFMTLDLTLSWPGY